MFLRIRYFPAIFLALVVSLLLLIPYYYLDTWVTVPLLKVEDTSWQPTPSSPHRALPQPVPVPVPVPQPWQSIHWNSSEQPEDVQPNEILPQVAPPFNFMHFRPDPVEFALQMARDRIRIERFGMRPPMVRSRSWEHNALGNDSYPEDTEEGRQANATEGSKPLQVLVVTYFRGGTTFFGDMLNQYPGTFYHFEPLHTISFNDQAQDAGQVAEAIRLLRHLLRCQYESVPRYLEWVRQDDHRFLFEHNHRLWLGCQFQPHLCFQPKFLGAMCRIHPIHVFKLVRLRLAHARRLMDEFPDLQVVYLVRDPRGLYSSRRDLGWCNTTRSCIEPGVFCADMRRDLATALAMRRSYPGRFMALRYEDLALNPKAQIQKVLHQLKLEFNGKLERFIESHTGENGGGPYSTRRDSRRTAFSWRRKLSPHEVEYVEAACSDVIKQLSLP